MRATKRIQIQLEPHEAALLREVLAEDLAMFRTDLAGNDWQDIARPLRIKEDLLRRLIDRLSE